MQVAGEPITGITEDKHQTIKIQVSCFEVVGSHTLNFRSVPQVRHLHNPSYLNHRRAAPRQALHQIQTPDHE